MTEWTWGNDRFDPGTDATFAYAAGIIGMAYEIQRWHRRTAMYAACVAVADANAELLQRLADSDQNPETD